MGMPNKNRANRYGIKKKPPPYLLVKYGNRQKFPVPTAEPMETRMNVGLLSHLSLLPASAISVSFFDLQHSIHWGRVGYDI